ncbi:MAG: hypothetical protein KAR24_02975 [Candidatus Pacebacteria bacterium]|nr:hypothetical protein [Candidatus Paceibacterota bacterium]
MTKIKILLGLLMALALTGGVGYALFGGSDGDNEKEVVTSSSNNVEKVYFRSPAPSKDLICKTFEKVFPEGYRKQDKYTPPYRENWAYIDGSCFVDQNERIMENGSTKYYETRVAAIFLNEEGKSILGVRFLLNFKPDPDKENGWIFIEN